MLKRIQFMAEQGLMSLMMLFDFLSRRITPLQQHVHAAWLYTGENNTTRLECDCGIDLGMKVLGTMLSKLCSNSISVYLITPPPAILLVNLHGSGDEVEAAEGDAHAR
jgi:hypothetical protein